MKTGFVLLYAFVPRFRRVTFVSGILLGLAILPSFSQRSPSPKREFRAVWIATVDNIDWPSRKGMSSDKQKAEFQHILDHHQRAGINAVIVQVRAAADAFYAKSPEPWSEWLTGEQGRIPDPFYDPLEFMIQESHDRGIEFHAWLNLDRATYSRYASISVDHISLRRPDWLFEYGGRKLFNLGIPVVRDYVVSLVMNLIRNYDVDGIHFDDYFYPYAIAGQTIKDDETFRLYRDPQKPGMTKQEWRRDNVSRLIQQLHDSIQVTKPHVKFGISPFGVWKNQSQDPEGSPTTGGLTAYYDLYADVRKWVLEGWIDYVAPQVYFSSDFAKVPYRPLVDWWTKNSFSRHLYIGQGAYRLGQPTSRDLAWRDFSEMPNQLRFNRQYSQIQGSIFFSSKSLMSNLNSIRDSLSTDFYRYPALVPTMPWKDPEPPLSPKELKASVTSEGVELRWKEPTPAPDGDRARYYAIYRFDRKSRVQTDDPAAILALCIGEQTTHFLDRSAEPDKRYVYVVTAIDRLHNESEASRVSVRIPE